MDGIELVRRTQNLVRNRPVTKRYRTIARDLTEYGVTEQWIKDFMSGRAPNSPAHRVEALYNYLSPTPLFPKV